VSYLAEKIKTKVPVKNGAPIGTYQVIIKFMVDKNGEILNPQAETNAGYGMEEEGIRVIKKSPKWIPGISLGETKISYRRQPLTFIVK
jgi:protein TonB